MRKFPRIKDRMNVNIETQQSRNNKVPLGFVLLNPALYTNEANAQVNMASIVSR